MFRIGIVGQDPMLYTVMVVFEVKTQSYTNLIPIIIRTVIVYLLCYYHRRLVMCTDKLQVKKMADIVPIRYILVPCSRLL